MKLLSRTKKKAKRIGAEQEDFELEVETVPVVVRKTFKDRIIDAVWVMAATAIAATVVQVYIIPLLQ